MKTAFWMGLAAGAAMLAAAGPARAAYVADTGFASPAAGGSSPYAFAAGTGHYAQFTLAQATRITGIEYYGTAATAGLLSVSLFFADRGTEALGTNRYYGESQVAQQTTAGWIGKTDMAESGAAGVELQAGTWWVGAFSPGTLTGTHWWNAPRGLDQELLTTLATGTTSIDAAELSWRITGEVVAAAPAAPVPEPASWAAMLAGVAMVGAGLRRRRASVAFN